MGTEQAVAAEGLGKRFGPVRALAGVDLAVPASGVLGLLGPNGAGKTTLVRILATLLRPDQGRARVCGLDVTRQPDQVRRLVGLSGQYAAVDAFLTGRENLRMVGRLADQLVVMDHGRVIASGTAAALKAQVGGDRLELQAPPGADPARLAAAMAGLGAGAPAVDRALGRVVVPVADGPGVLPEVAARLAAGGLRVADLALRRPTLDDVFLALTGQPTGPDAPADPDRQDPGGKGAAA